MKTSSNAVRCEPVLTRWLLATIIVLVTLTLPVEVGRAAESRSRTDSGPLAGALGNGIRITAIHATGRNPIKEFWVIAGTRPQVGGEQAKEVVNWQPHTLRAGHEGELIWPLDKAYDEMALRVEADGYAPQVMAWLEKKKAPQNIVFELRENQGTAGRVLTPDGKPAAGATLALAMVQRDAVVENGKLRHANEPLPERPSDCWRRPRFVQADAEGRFQLPPESDPTAAVLITHENGVRELALADFKKAPEVKLQPWGSVEGKIHWGDVVGSNRAVSLNIYRDNYGYPGVIGQNEKTISAGDGTFAFERVLPGGAQISCSIPATPGNESEVSGFNPAPLITHVTVQTGANSVLLGGQGRTVRGRLTGRATWTDVTFHFHPTAPHVGLPGDEKMWKAWGTLQKSPVGSLFFRNDLNVNVDGTFEIQRVLPGNYQIFFHFAGEKGNIASGKFVVSPEMPGVKPEPQNIGEFRSRSGS